MSETSKTLAAYLELVASRAAGRRVHVARTIAEHRARYGSITRATSSSPRVVSLILGCMGAIRAWYDHHERQRARRTTSTSRSMQREDRQAARRRIEQGCMCELDGCSRRAMRVTFVLRGEDVVVIAACVAHQRELTRTRYARDNKIKRVKQLASDIAELSSSHGHEHDVPKRKRRARGAMPKKLRALFSSARARLEALREAEREFRSVRERGRSMADVHREWANEQLAGVAHVCPTCGRGPLLELSHWHVRVGPCYACGASMGGWSRGTLRLLLAPDDCEECGAPRLRECRKCNAARRELEREAMSRDPVASPVESSSRRDIKQRKLHECSSHTMPPEWEGLRCPRCERAGLKTSGIVVVHVIDETCERGESRIEFVCRRCLAEMGDVT